MKHNNVIPFEREAEFYFDLSYKNHQKGCLKTALRYIEKAVRMKPADGFLQFNYAGILAELGYIEHSSKVLLNVINNIDPNYDECYFGLACNYLQLQKVKKAIEYFEKYADISPNGPLIEETINFIEILNMIKDSNNDLDDDELEDIYKVEDKGIKHLERKEYKKALNCFQEVVIKLPNAIPAKNNLSLTHYYIGNLDKAIEIAKEVIEYEPNNIHANCNLCIYYNELEYGAQTDRSNRFYKGNPHYQRDETESQPSKKILYYNLLEKQIRIVRKLNPYNEDYAFKVADTFGCLSRHKEAYKAYKRLLRFDKNNPQYLHHLAAASYNCKRFGEAIGLWEDLKNIDKDSFVADYYCKIAKKTISKKRFEPIAYNYQLPKNEITRRVREIHYFLSLPKNESKEYLSKDNNIKEFIYFGIIFDTNVIRKEVFRKIKIENLIELEPILRKYLLRTDIEKKAKIEAVFLLSIIGAKEPYKVKFDDEVQQIAIEPQEIREVEWKEKWDDVKDKAIISMEGSYESPYKNIVEDIWFDFIRSAYPEVPTIGKIEIWAAALEYAYCKFTCKEATQQQLAEKYGVSRSSLSEKFRIIYEHIGNKFWGAD